MPCDILLNSIYYNNTEAITGRSSKPIQNRIYMQISLKKRWQVAEPIPPEVEQRLSAYPEILRQLMFNRGIRDVETAKNYLAEGGTLHDPFLMSDMDATVDRLAWAIDRGERIAVYGDYDVDGVTATALMVQILKMMGAHVQGYIPNRFEEGYGLNNEALDTLSRDGVTLVVTVDCGIRSPGEVAYGQQLGIDIIVSDHHEPKDHLPEARAVVCPKRSGDAYPEKNLAGVGIAFKICEGLLTQRPSRQVHLPSYLDLVAVGTVADIVPLVGENRSIVKAGLEELRCWRRQGLFSLARAAEFDVQNVTARDIGFVIGPRLNAAGRLDSALAAYELLITDQLEVAGSLAQKLDNQNRERQELTLKMQQQAELMAQVGAADALIFAVHPEFNMGVVGLVASRLADQHYRPAVVGSQVGEYTRASCRSIPEFHITHALDECSDLFERHGGHAMAAGFTIRNDRLPELMQRMREIAARELGGKDLCPVLKADLEIPLRYLKPEVLTFIDALEPTGLGNPGALFVSRDVKVQRYRTVGRDGSHLRLTVSDSGVTYDAIAFRQGRWAEAMPERVDLLYAYEQNVYNGRPFLQLNVRDLKPTGEADS